jgi:acyl carrier protein
MPDQTEAPQYQTELELRKAVRSIILEIAPNANQQPFDKARLVEDLGYHSLALLELAFALEDEFDLRPIDEPTARKIVTLMDVENHVVKEFRSTGRLK